jgi:hypothetical protein
MRTSTLLIHPARRSRPGRRYRPLTDAGSASVISIAIVFPPVAILILAGAQAMTVAAAHSVALGAAEEGLRVARAHHATLTSGRAAALDFARREPVLAGPTVTATGGTSITIVVRGQAPSLLGLRFRITGTARGPAERFTTRSQP